IPDPALFPQEAVAEAYRHVLTQTGPSALQYSVSDGDPALKDWIVGHMARRGAPCGPENILITSGSQQALEFLGRLLISPGDTALVTAPTYLGALQAFSAYEPHYDALPAVATNRDAASYGGETAAPSFAYVVPDFANPSGETMSAAARVDLLALARDLGTLIIEDSPYSELRFEGEAPPSLLAMDIADTGHIDRSRVVHCGSFSKIFMPGLRVGWVCARADLIERLVLIKQASDLNAPRINQLAILRLAETLYDEQVVKARAAYRVKRDAMLAALAAHMPDGVRWTHPEGGMFIWLEVDGAFDAKAMLPAAVEAGVAYVPGAAFHHDGAGRNAMRLSYSLPDPETIETGVRRLSALISENLAGGRSAS
ncbi:MAG: PLP-dependent aminotransferase family protein, partial [Pseudomonadota bacterium]